MTEFSRTQNQFTNDQIAAAKLLIISDVEFLTRQQKDILKRLLGSDNLTFEVKFQLGVKAFTPKCQVLFVSNLAPEEFPLLASDEAFMEKIIPVQYNEQSTIDPQFQIANLKHQRDIYIPELLNWAALAPMQNLQFSIRAMRYRAIKGKSSRPNSFCDFLMENFWYNPHKEVEVIPIQDIKNAMEKYGQETGEESLISFINADSKANRYSSKTTSDF